MRVNHFPFTHHDFDYTASSDIPLPNHHLKLPPSPQFDNTSLFINPDWTPASLVSHIEHTFLSIIEEKRSRERDENGNIIPLNITIKDVHDVLTSLRYWHISILNSAQAKALTERVIEKLELTDQVIAALQAA